MRLDFSRFHPLDHWPGTRRCWTLPGGIRQHLQVAWMLGRRDQVMKPVYRLFLCPLGRHDVRVSYFDYRDGPTYCQAQCAFLRVHAAAQRSRH